MKIIFMGTPDFAVPSLAALVEQGYDIVGVITAPDRPAGRGQKLRPSAVKKYALSKGLRVLQPPRLKNKAFLAELKSLEADLQVVVAFRMLPALVFEMPPLGTFNLHAALLPQYRGAAPINWAVINGETETGATTFFIDQHMDTGEMIFQEKIPIGPADTAGEVHDRLMEMGAKLVLKTVQAIEKGEHPRLPQTIHPDAILHKAPKIFKADCQINWDQAAKKVYDFIRGLSPYPAAFTTIEMPKTKEKKTLKIFQSTIVSDQLEGEVGSWQTDGKSYLRFVTADGGIEVLELQLAGRKRMTIDVFMRGYGAQLVFD